jgi:hypothetical protein
MTPHKWKETYRNVTFIRYKCELCDSEIATTVENHIVTTSFQYDDCDLEIAKQVTES